MIKYLQTNSLIIDRYLIQGYIAKGGMGAVYRAFDNRLKCNVAIKQNLLDPNELTIQMFQREAELLANLKHEGLPKVTDYFHYEKYYYLVMDLVEGEDLQNRIDRGEIFTYEEGLHFFEKLLDILIYLHNHNIFHLDIKPSNIKIDEELNLRLLDFGVAKGRIGQVTTDENIKGGTPLYMSLEQTGYLENQNITLTNRSDIYSASATFYHLFAGSPPIPALHRHLIAQNEGIDPLRLLSDLNKDIPESIALIFQNGMELLPDKRIPSAFEFKEFLLKRKGDKYKKYNKWSSIKKTNYFPESFSFPFETGIFPTKMEHDNGNSEIGLLLKDNTPFVYKIASLKPFTLNLKTVLYQTSHGFIVCALFYLVNPSDPKRMFAGFESFINIYNPSLLSSSYQLARQSHWHLWIIDGLDKIVDVFEFENCFDLENFLNYAVRNTRKAPRSDFMLAKKEFMETFSVDDIFNNL